MAQGDPPVRCSHTNPAVKQGPIMSNSCTLRSPPSLRTCARVADNLADRVPSGRPMPRSHTPFHSQVVMPNAYSGGFTPRDMSQAPQRTLGRTAQPGAAQRAQPRTSSREAAADILSMEQKKGGGEEVSMVGRSARVRVMTRGSGPRAASAPSAPRATRPPQSAPR